MSQSKKLTVAVIGAASMIGAVCAVLVWWASDHPGHAPAVAQADVTQAEVAAQPAAH